MCFLIGTNVIFVLGIGGSNRDMDEQTVGHNTDRYCSALGNWGGVFHMMRCAVTYSMGETIPLRSSAESAKEFEYITEMIQLHGHGTSKKHS